MRTLSSLLGAASLAAICATTSGSAIPAGELLFGRASTCAPSFSQCNVDKFPSSFCCQAGSTCIPLAANTTLICCPEGNNCATIAPISCNITKQDAASDPTAGIKTTALQSVLETCGDHCCPFGYSCTGGNSCVMDKDQNTPPPPPPTTTSSSSSSTASSSSTSSSSGTSAPATTPTSSPLTSTVQPTPTVDSTIGSVAAEGTNAPSSGPPVGLIAGVTAGAAAAIIIAIAFACFLVKRKNKPSDELSLKLTRSSSSFGNIISNPIIVEGTAMRSDFNRGGPAKRSMDRPPVKRSGSVSSLSSAGAASASEDRTRARNLTANGLRASSVAFGYPGTGGPPPYSGGHGAATAAASSPARSPSPPSPRTPTTTRQQYREPSSVSINVFADPLTLTPQTTARQPADTRRHSAMTTFTEMMVQADLGSVARGEGYVPFQPDTPKGGSPARR